ncbi:MAG: N-acetyltransferase [Pseudooceanicola sp.]|nr:N-acetyltransferase [Pseudooceanicola sp.]
MILRPATAADARAICAIVNPIIRDTTITFTTVERTPEAVTAEISERLPAFLVAEDDGTVLGYATYGPFRGGPGYAYTREHSVHLALQARGKATGRALMEALEQVARRQGIHVLVAGISAENLAAIAFHARLGFTETGRMPQVGTKFGQWHDLVLMQKILRAIGAPDSGPASL